MSAIFRTLFKSREQQLKEESARLDREIALANLEKEVQKKREELDRLKSGQQPGQKSRKANR